MPPDGKRVVSASYDHSLKVWDFETGVPVAAFHSDAALRAVRADLDRII